MTTKIYIKQNQNKIYSEAKYREKDPMKTQIFRLWTFILAMNLVKIAESWSLHPIERFDLQFDLNLFC